ncbi:MAG TPA: hypothetical protein DCQ64_25355 [Candidatus Rokubacteria bacterium]|nr:hypothetical protein [Candidatus Rokubacteria bacterium]
MTRPYVSCPGPAPAPGDSLGMACGNYRCRRDDAEIDDHGFCPTCQPHENETCADWLDRMDAMGPQP